MKPFGAAGKPDTFCTCERKALPQNHLDVPGRCYRELKPGACRMHHTFADHVRYSEEEA